MNGLSVLEYVIGGLLGILGIVLIVLIMMQQSIRRGLSGTISGGASETFYGKNKRKSKARMLNKATMYLGIVFAALVLSLYIVHTVTVRQDNEESSTSAANSAATSSAAAVTSETSSSTDTSSTESLYETESE